MIKGDSWAGVTPAQASKAANAAKNPSRMGISSYRSYGFGKPRKAVNINLLEWHLPG